MQDKDYPAAIAEADRLIVLAEKQLDTLNGLRKSLVDKQSQLPKEVENEQDTRSD